MEQIKLHQFAEKLELRGYSKRTIVEYPASVRLFCEYLDKKENITSFDEIQPHHITGYQTELQFGTAKGRRLSPVSVCCRLGALKAFYRIMHEEKLIKTDLSEDIQLPIVRRHLPRYVPSIEEMQRILDAAGGDTLLLIRDRAMLEFLYATGIRSEELRTIGVDDYDLNEHRVFIKGKGSHERMVPVGAWVAGYVSRYLAESRPSLVDPRVSTIKGAVPLLFVSCHGNMLRRNDLWHIVHRYALKAKVKHLMPHSFRHACATHLLHNGADIRIVQELLGHRSLASTQVYTRVDIHDLQKAHTKFHPREQW